MRQATALIAAAIAVAVAAGGGYWLGRGGSAPAPATTGADGGSGAKKERKLLYYRNPMGLPDTSPVPKKDSMGMDYIAVYEGEAEEAGAGQLKISTDRVQKLGVRTEPAQLRALDRVVRAAGRVEVDERRMFAIAPKFEGWVERLHVNVTGQPVAKGQPLFDVYSPELVSAQREYAIAAQGVESLKDADPEARATMRQLAEASLARLANWDIAPGDIKALTASGETHRRLTFRSPAAGVVTEKKALPGMRFMPGETLYQVADLSSVWVLADVFEQDIGRVRAGSEVTVRVNAYPDRAFTGRVGYVYPTLKAETRTVPVRVELANPGGLLKPAMYAEVELPAAATKPVLTVPASAVIDTGTRRVAIVQVGEGRFEPRELKTGARGEDRIEILDGIRAGEAVVVAANFLLDAESNLKAALGGLGGGDKKAEKMAKAIGHRATGTLDAYDAKTGTATISHAPVASLNWPAMTMEFSIPNTALVDGVKPGAAIEFEFVERKAGEWVVTQLAARPAKAK